MKKILAAVLCLAFAVQSSFALTVIPKIGIDIPGTMNYDEGPDNETKRGFMIGAEVREKISNYFSWGAGFEYVLPRGLSGVPGDNDFSFFPVYVSLMFYPFGAWEKVKPYIKVNAGYSVLAATQAKGDMKGGLYRSAGVGTEYKNFAGEVMACAYSGEHDGMGLTYQKIGFVLGYKFNVDLFKSKSGDEY